jgi:hypothetical protein
VLAKKATIINTIFGEAMFTLLFGATTLLAQ